YERAKRQVVVEQRLGEANGLLANPRFGVGQAEFERARVERPEHVEGPERMKARECSRPLFHHRSQYAGDGAVASLEQEALSRLAPPCVSVGKEMDQIGRGSHA